MKQIILITTTFILSLTSCIKDIDLSEYITSPKLVMNATLFPDRNIEVEVTRTWFIGTPKPNEAIEDAKVNLYVNEEWKEELNHKIKEDSTGKKAIYFSQYKPQRGETLRIEVSKEGFHDASSTDIIPDACKIKSYTTERIKNNNRLCELTIKDNPDNEDYYAIYMFYQDTVINGEPVYKGFYPKILNENLIINEEKSFIDKIFDTGSHYLNYTVEPKIFNDRSFNGKDFTVSISIYSPLRMKINADGSYYNCFMRVYTLSESYYRFLESILFVSGEDILKDMANQGLTDPPMVFSNVKNGAGMIGACNYYDIPVK